INPLHETLMSRSIRPALFAVLIPVALAQIAKADDAALVSEAQPAAHVTVVGNKESEDKYRVESVDSLGPLGSLKLLDAPYTIGILSEDLIKNSQATNFKDVSKYMPLVAYKIQ